MRRRRNARLVADSDWPGHLSPTQTHSDLEIMSCSACFLGWNAHRRKPSPPVSAEISVPIHRIVACCRVSCLPFVVWTARPKASFTVVALTAPDSETAKYIQWL